MDTARYSKIVGMIYDAALASELWPATLGELRAEAGFATASLVLHRATDQHALLAYFSGLNAEDQSALNRLTPDLAVLWGGMDEVMARPIDAPWLISRIASREQIAASPFYREWALPRGLIDNAAVILARDSRLIGSIGLGRHASAGPVRDAELARLRLFVPHLQRAARISGLLEARQAEAATFLAIMDRLASPVFVLNADLTIAYANPQGRNLLAGRDLLADHHGALASPVPGLRTALLKAARQAHDGDWLIAGTGTGMPVRTAAGRDYALHLMPLAGGAERPLLMPGACVALFVSDARISHRFDEDVLIGLFELTPTEVRVFTAIARGLTTREACAELGMAFSTLRTHLLRIFEKSGTNRQADLIRMAMALTAPVGIHS